MAVPAPDPPGNNCIALGPRRAHDRLLGLLQLRSHEGRVNDIGSIRPRPPTAPSSPIRHRGRRRLENDELLQQSPPPGRSRPTIRSSARSPSTRSRSTRTITTRSTRAQATEFWLLLDGQPGHSQVDRRRRHLGGAGSGCLWTGLAPAAGQFPQYQAVGKVRVDPHNSNNVVAGTKTGLFFSYDGGTNWTGPCTTEQFQHHAPGHHRP